MVVKWSRVVRLLQMTLPAAEGKSQLVYCVIQIPAITSDVFITATWNYKYKHKIQDCDSEVYWPFVRLCDAKPVCCVEQFGIELAFFSSILNKTVLLLPREGEGARWTWQFRGKMDFMVFLFCLSKPLYCEATCLYLLHFQSINNHVYLFILG